MSDYGPKVGEILKETGDIDLLNAYVRYEKLEAIRAQKNCEGAYLNGLINDLGRHRELLWAEEKEVWDEIRDVSLYLSVYLAHGKEQAEPYKQPVEKEVKQKP